MPRAFSKREACSKKGNLVFISADCPLEADRGVEGGVAEDSSRREQGNVRGDESVMVRCLLPRAGVPFSRRDIVEDETCRLGKKIGVIMEKERTGNQIEASQVYLLDSLVDYAESATVSRIITKNSAGSVTLFAFDQGQSLSEHSTPFDALVLVIDGEVKLTIGGEPVVARKGEVVLMPANVPHAVSAVERFKMLLTMLRGN